VVLVVVYLLSKPGHPLDYPVSLCDQQLALLSLQDATRDYILSALLPLTLLTMINSAKIIFYCAWIVAKFIAN
jgi:hypothetical protein